MRFLTTLFMVFAFTANVTFAELFYSKWDEQREFIKNLFVKGEIITKSTQVYPSGTATDTILILYKNMLYGCQVRGFVSHLDILDVACADLIFKKK